MNYNATKFSLYRTEFQSDSIKTSDRDFRLKIKTPTILEWKPGQFVMLKWGEHIIGRPFAIVSWEKQDECALVEVWVRRLGAATEELFSYAKQGLECEVILPLGEPLPVSYYEQSSKILFVSGGVGGASLLPLFEARKNIKASSDFWIHGERSHGDLDQSLPFSQLCLEEKTQASIGYLNGRVTSALDRLVEGNFTHIICCGPTAMLAAIDVHVEKSSLLKSIPCYFGLEEKMGCGIGLCFSCSVKTTEGMKRCCYEGPWFERNHMREHFSFRGVAPSVG